MPPPPTSADVDLAATLYAMDEGFQLIGRDWRYRFVNPAAAAHGQSTPAALVGRTMMEAYPGIEHTPIFATMRACMVDGTPARLDNAFRLPDGSEGWFELSIQSVPDGIVVISLDITARKRAQMAVQQDLTDLGERNAELQDFASVASHDLQEPLRKILVFGDRLIEQRDGALPEKALDWLRRMTSAAERMQRLIDGLLELSRASADRPAQIVDLGVEAAAALDDLEARLDADGGRVDVGDLPCIEGDATQMRQVMQNLIGNALKFKHDTRGPVVSVTASRTALADGAPAWAIRVADNGIGFAAADAQRIFAPFLRLHGRSRYEGSGIGLAIVRRIVERHHGHVSAAAVAGEGATFTVVLPERQPRADGAR